MTTSEFNWQTMPLIDGTWMQWTKSFENMLNGFGNVFKMINRWLCCVQNRIVYIFCMNSHASTRTRARTRARTPSKDFRFYGFLPHLKIYVSRMISIIKYNNRIKFTKAHAHTHAPNQTTVCGCWLTFSIGGLQVYEIVVVVQLP